MGFRIGSFNMRNIGLAALGDDNSRDIEKIARIIRDEELTETGVEANARETEQRGRGLGTVLFFIIVSAIKINHLLCRCAPR